MKKIFITLIVSTALPVVAGYSLDRAKGEMVIFKGREKIQKVYGSVKIKGAPFSAIMKYTTNTVNPGDKNIFQRVQNRLPETRELDIKTVSMLPVEYDLGKENLPDFESVCKNIPINCVEDFVNQESDVVEVVYKPLNGEPKLICLTVDRNELARRGITPQSLDNAFEDRQAFLNAADASDSSDDEDNSSSQGSDSSEDA